MCNEMREINLEIMFKDIFFDYSYYILDKIEKMDMCYIFFINMRNWINLLKWFVFDYIKRLLI